MVPNLVVVVTAALTGAPAERLSIRPSFTLEHCAWTASDIVVASETGPGGRVEVRSVWKGGLSAGDELTVTDLPPAKDLKEDPPWGGHGDAPAKAMTGERIVLFLSRKPKADGSTEAWVGAQEFGGAKVSTVWVEDGWCYAFEQVINPGPSRLVSLRTTEEELLKKMATILEERTAYDAAEAQPDLAVRALLLTPLVHSQFAIARDNGVPALGRCGEPALPVLRELIRDGQSDQGAVVRALSVAAGAGAGEELTPVLEAELDYWRELGPSLPEGWWNDIKNWPRTNERRDRYCLLLETVRVLGEKRHPPARELVTQLRDLWSSLPTLNDKSGLNHMVKVCDEALANMP